MHSKMIYASNKHERFMLTREEVSPTERMLEQVLIFYKMSFLLNLQKLS
jgi:hypothetical protein